MAGMISIEKAHCTKCGVCIRIAKGYCIDESEGYPVFDLAICNTCQKCVAVCPYRAIMVNDTYPDKIDGAAKRDHFDLLPLLERRRSTKHFNGRRELRRKLKITDAVLGVLALGFSSENIVNIPRGYEVPIRRNVE